jgi:hypothetical protein
MHQAARDEQLRLMSRLRLPAIILVDTTATLQCLPIYILSTLVLSCKSTWTSRYAFVPVVTTHTMAQSFAESLAAAIEDAKAAIAITNDLRQAGSTTLAISHQVNLVLKEIIGMLDKIQTLLPPSGPYMSFAIAAVPDIEPGGLLRTTLTDYTSLLETMPMAAVSEAPKERYLSRLVDFASYSSRLGKIRRRLNEFSNSLRLWDLNSRVSHRAQSHDGTTVESSTSISETRETTLADVKTLLLETFEEARKRAVEAVANAQAEGDAQSAMLKAAEKLERAANSALARINPLMTGELVPEVMHAILDDGASESCRTSVS